VPVPEASSWLDAARDPDHVSPPRDGLLVELQGKRGMLARIVASDDKVTLL
jgi:hypothetical protein